MSDFGTALRHHRKHTYGDQANLADAIGVSQMTVSRWERNIDRPSLTNLARLAEASLTNSDLDQVQTILHEAVSLALDKDLTQ